jgi:hypothetical protein
MAAESQFDSVNSSVVELARRKGNGWMRLIYRLFLHLIPLAEPPKEEELRADLYVMF